MSRLCARPRLMGRACCARDWPTPRTRWRKRTSCSMRSAASSNPSPWRWRDSPRSTSLPGTERSADAAQETALLVDSVVRAAASGSAVDVDGLARSVESIATVMANVVRATSEDRVHLEQIAGVMEYLAELMPRTADQASAAAEAGAELVARTQALWASQARIVLPEARARGAGGSGEPAGSAAPATAV